LVLRLEGGQDVVARWRKGEKAVLFLIDRGRLEIFEAGDLTTLAEAQVGRAALRLRATAASALENGDVDGAYAAAYDAYRMAAEALLGRQGLRATGSHGSHMTVEDAVSAQFADEIPAFAKPIFERLRRTRHTAQYFDPSAAPITEADTEWAIRRAMAALAGVKALLSKTPPERFG
jgi:HEPN domain-containing protein